MKEDFSPIMKSALEYKKMVGLKSSMKNRKPIMPTKVLNGSDLMIVILLVSKYVPNDEKKDQSFFVVVL